LRNVPISPHTRIEECPHFTHANRGMSLRFPRKRALAIKELRRKLPEKRRVHDELVASF
jgi:hypothetical protein